MIRSFPRTVGFHTARPADVRYSTYETLPTFRQGFFMLLSGGQFHIRIVHLPKRILVVAHDRLLKATRVSLLESQGIVLSPSNRTTLP
jgi:hypothetical protein